MPRRRRLVPPIVSLLCALSVAAAMWPRPADGARPVRLTKGPYLTGLSESGVEVRFELDGPAPAVIEVGADGAHGARPRTFEDRTAAAMHVVRASQLTAATRYSYVVRVDGKAAGRGTFTTAPKEDSGAPIKFLVYGDDRTDPTAHAAVARALAASPSDFLVNTGDMVEDGGRAEDWQAFFDIEAKLLRDRALFVAIGNHELYDDRAGANFARYFGFPSPNGTVVPYGTMRLSSVRFFFLNSSHDWGSGEERQWLERELGRCDDEAGVVWRVAVMHQGPWSSGPHGASGALVAGRVPQLLAAHRVDLLLAGHDHIYERGESAGIKYVISGGGGAPLYRASKVASTRRVESTYHFVEVTTGSESIRLVARRIDGSVLDECGMAKGRGWDCDVTEAAGGPAGRSQEADASAEARAADASDEVRANDMDTGPAAPPHPAASSTRCACGVLGACVASVHCVPVTVGAIAVACARRRRRRIASTAAHGGDRHATLSTRWSGARVGLRSRWVFWPRRAAASLRPPRLPLPRSSMPSCGSSRKRR
jgi:hypothetical protein